jgi:hypothetical protein
MLERNVINRPGQRHYQESVISRVPEASVTAAILQVEAPRICFFAVAVLSQCWSGGHPHLPADLELQ